MYNKNTKKLSITEGEIISIKYIGFAKYNIVNYYH